MLAFASRIVRLASGALHATFPAVRDGVILERVQPMLVARKLTLAPPIGGQVVVGATAERIVALAVVVASAVAVGVTVGCVVSTVTVVVELSTAKAKTRKFCL